MTMEFLTIEHSKAAYRADFALHGLAVLGLAGWLIGASPREVWLQLMCVALIGLLGWTAVEYVLHRFLLHGLRPFCDWHAQHHQRPKALIYAPTFLVALCFAAGVALPAWTLFDEWVAGALTLGMLCGYGIYSVTHHATHHGHGGGLWLKRRKHWHAVHHHQVPPACYGVTTHIWDHVFRTQGPSRAGDARPSWSRGAIGASPPTGGADQDTSYGARGPVRQTRFALVSTMERTQCDGGYRCRSQLIHPRPTPFSGPLCGGTDGAHHARTTHHHAAVEYRIVRR